MDLMICILMWIHSAIPLLQSHYFSKGINYGETPVQFFVGDVHVWKRYSGSKQTVWCAYYWTWSILLRSSGGGVLGCSSTSLLVAVLCIARMICAAPVRHTLLSNTTSSHHYGETGLLSIPTCKTDSICDLECAIISTYLGSICICFSYLIKVLYINKT